MGRLTPWGVPSSNRIGAGPTEGAQLATAAAPTELRQRYADNPLAAKLATVEVAIAAVLLRLAYVECSHGVGCPICVLERCGEMFGVSRYDCREILRRAYERYGEGKRAADAVPRTWAAALGVLRWARSNLEAEIVGALRQGHHAG